MPDEIQLEDPADLPLSTLGFINTDQLMLEVEHFPNIYGRVCEVFFDATSTLAAAKANLSEIETKLEAAARKHLGLATTGRVTDKAVSTAVHARQEYIDAVSDVSVAELEVERCKLALRVLDKKERMLDVLGRFHTKEYVHTT